MKLVARARMLPVVVPFGLAVLLMAPATLGDKVLSASDVALYSAPFSPPPASAQPSDALQSDSGFVFEPDGLLVRDALRHGRLPVWTSGLSAGLPLLADQQSAPLFPLTWIDVVFPYWESQAWINVLEITIAALGTFLLCRALDLRRSAALVGGLAFGFGTYLLLWLLHPHANAYVLLPWLFLAAERLSERGTVRDAAVLGGALGLAFLGGQPESSLIVSLAAAAWLIHRLLGARLPRREVGRRLALAALSGALGGALGAVMVLPFLEALHQSYATSRSHPPLPVSAIITVFFPKFWAAGGPSNFAERTLYVGALPTLLAAAGLAARRPRGPQLFFAALAVAALAVALDTGPFSSAVRHLPVFDQVNLVRVLILGSFAIAMLAAFGCQRLLDATAAERRRMLVAAAVVCMLPALIALGGHPSWLRDLPHAARHVIWSNAPTPTVQSVAAVLRWLVFAVAALALMAALTRWRERRAVLMAAAIGLTALDLLAIGKGYNPAIAKAAVTPPMPPAVAVMRQLTDGGGRVVGVDALEPNTATRWGLDDARGHEDPVVGRVSLLWFALGGGIELNAPGVVLKDPRTPKLLDVFGVKAILLEPTAGQGSKLPLAAPLRGGAIAYTGPGGLVVSNPHALPPAFVAYRWRPSPSRKDSLLLMAAGTARQARDEPVIETNASSRPGPAPPATPARIVSRTDTEVTLDVRARAAGQLVLLDTFYPGWRAQVDGHATPIRPADEAFRAIAVSAGHHVVRFYYRPTSVIVGGGISIVALLAIVACLVLGGQRGLRFARGRRRRASVSTPPSPPGPSPAYAVNPADRRAS